MEWEWNVSMEQVRNYIILKTKILNMVSEETKKVSQTYWCQDNIAG